MTVTAALSLSAEVVGGSFARDAEMRLPERPRYLSEAVMLPYGNAGLLFEGVRGTQLLSGRAARGFVPRLLELLDGTRTLDELMRACVPVPPQAVHDAVAMLFSRGLLEDGCGPAAPAELQEVAAFCGRYVDVTRVNRNRHQALDRLAAGRVALAGSPPARDALSQALQQQGLDGVSTPAAPQDLDGLDPAKDLVIAVFEPGDADADRWLDAAWQRGLRLLHARVGTARVEIGPLLMPGRSGCHHCLRQLRPLPPADMPAADVGFWCGVVALQAWHLQSRIGNPDLYNVCHTHQRTAQGPVYEETRLARLPGCAHCGLAGRGPRIDEPGGLIWLLHCAANGMPPRELLSPRDHQMHYAAANIAITKEAPEPYHGAVRVALPPAASLAVAPAWDGLARPPRTPDLPTLAALLRHAVGHAEAPSPRRIAPSAGGLGCAEVFVIVRQLAGLPGGTYRYNAHEHLLERLRSTSDELLAGALGLIPVELPPLLLVGTANLTKVRRKYNDFAFRFAHLDAGVARAYLCDMLRSLGIAHAELVDARDKALADAIGLPTIGTRNLVTYTLGIGEPAGRADLSLVSPSQYVDLLADLAGQRPRALAPPTAAAPGKAALPVGMRETLEHIVLKRRSVRRFAPEPLALPTARQIVALAAGMDAVLTEAGSLPVRMTLWLAIGAGREDGDDSDESAGVYRWNAAEARLERRRQGLRAEDLLATMLQRSLAEAPAVLLITGDFEHAVRQHGARGYRELLSRAGAIAARALLAAQALRVAGCPWGGLSEDGWGRLLDIDRYTDCPLFGVSLGHAGDEN